MLFYVSEAHAALYNGSKIIVPEALAAHIEEQNQELAVKRKAYEKLENEIEVELHFSTKFTPSGHCMLLVESRMDLSW
jgi:hypothetical protein